MQIFITRSHSFFFMERPSLALMGAFCLAQLISSIIAAYGDWGFSNVVGVSGGWIGITWVWNLIWFPFCDGIKFATRAAVHKWNAWRGKQITGIKPTEEGLHRTTSRAASMYSNRTTFLQRALRPVKLGKKTSISKGELTRFSSHQAASSGAQLARNPSRV